MTLSGDVQVTINDSGGAANINVPAPKVVCVAGVSSSGTANQPLSTKSISTLISNFGYGPLVQLCALLISLGATVIATKLTQTTAGGTTAVTATGSGTSVCTVTLDGTVGAFDTYFVKIVFTRTGTIGTAGYFTVSVDGGRTTGPEIALGTANTYVIPNTGITLNFAAGTNVVGDTRKFSTTQPLANATSVTTYLTALQASPQAQSGWGSMIVDGPYTGANITTIHAGLETLAGEYLFDRCMFNARDAAVPTGWGGAGETEATWVAALLLDFSAVTARRALVSAGHYNMPSAIASPVFGAPVLRRPASWAIQARKCLVAVQTLSSRASDGPLAQVVVDPTNNPSDGFLYHDERVNPGLDAGRFATLWTRLKQGQGFFVKSENLMSPLGSDYPLFAVGQCFDNFCSALVTYFTGSIDSNTRTNRNGTIYGPDARDLEKGAELAVAASMPGQYQPDNTSITVDLTYNVKANSKVLVSGVFGGLAYIREIDVDLSVQNPNAA